MLKPSQDWDNAFANMAYIDGSESLPQEWRERAEVYCASQIRIDQDVPYGIHPRERFDLVWPDEQPTGLVVFIHGGYWMQLDKSYWTDLAEGARANGWAVCLPSYTLAPETRISKITKQIGHAITEAAKIVSGPIRITGHSAGGHLATRMICDDTPLSDQVLARVAKAVPYCAWVGGGERPEFIRQSQLIVQVWSGLDIPADCHVDGQQNHFSVLDGLGQPDSDITLNLLGKP